MLAKPDTTAYRRHECSPAYWLASTLLALVLAMTGALPANAQDPSPSEQPAASQSDPAQPLTVATKVAPPFAIETDGGEWNGLAIELLRDITQTLDRPIVWRKYDTGDGVVSAVANGEADLGIAAISITGEREKIVDFSHAFYDSGLAIAINAKQGSGFWDVIQALTSPAFLTTVSMLGLLLLVTGAIIWVVERRRNTEQFHEEPVKGIGTGFWWAAVTMTTVGYGDKAPITPLGRAIAVIWMFAALILTAVFTAQLTTALTLEGISGPVAGPKDLPRAHVGVVAQSATLDYFNQRSMRPQGFESVKDGLQALEDGRIDAFVHDEPLLRYSVLRDFSGRVELLADVFEPQGYGIVLQPGSALREPINQALLAFRETERWVGIRRRYLGEQP